MRKQYLLGIVFISAAVAVTAPFQVNSKIASPPAGSSGDNFSKVSCAQSGCHPSPALTPGNTDYLLTIGTSNPPTIPLEDNFTYMQDSTYFIRLVLNSFTGRYGFQFSSMTTAATQAGSFPTPLVNTNNTKINTVAARQYMGHLGAGSNKDWTFKWKAPAATTGEVRFYFAFNTADANGQSSGDVIYRDSVIIMPDITGIPSLPEAIENFNVFPTATQGRLNILLSMKEAAIVSAKLYTIQGELAFEFFEEMLPSGSFQRSWDVQTLPSGIYLLQISAGGRSFAQKVIKSS